MWLIFKKEFKELLRDRKTIIFMIGLPLLLFPAIFGVAMFFMSSAADKAENKVLKYAIVGEAYAPAIVQSFSDASDKFQLATNSSQRRLLDRQVQVLSFEMGPEPSNEVWCRKVS